MSLFCSIDVTRFQRSTNTTLLYQKTFSSFGSKEGKEPRLTDSVLSIANINFISTLLLPLLMCQAKTKRNSAKWDFLRA